MLERVEGLPLGLVVLRAKGEVSKEDYEQVLVPTLEEARRQGRRIRFLYHFGPEFEGFTASAAWEDMQVGMRYLRLFQRCAVVSDREWIRRGARLAGVFMPCPVRVFEDAEWEHAMEWLQSPLEASPAYRILEDRGVLVVEPRGKLRTEDFDVLQASVDNWLEGTDGKLQGLVVHARQFPGWDDLGSALRHLQFVREHHRRIQRVAWAIDGKVASLTEPLARHFVEAEVKRFEADAVDDAIAWASGDSDAPSAQPQEREGALQERTP